MSILFLYIELDYRDSNFFHFYIFMKGIFMNTLYKVMKNTNKTLFLTVVFSFSTAKLKSDNFTDFFGHNFIDDMRTVLDQAQQGVQDIHAILEPSKKFSIKFEEQDTQVLIKVYGIHTEAFDASVADSGSEIKITTPTETIEINFEKVKKGHQNISIQATQKMHSEEKKEGKTGRGKGRAISTAIYSSSSHVTYGYMLDGVIDKDFMMKNAGELISYRADESVLTVKLPKLVLEKKSTGSVSIPVTISGAVKCADRQAVIVDKRECSDKQARDTILENKLIDAIKE